MSDKGSQHPRPAYCEEFSEEQQTTVPETRQSANVAAKRSKSDVKRAGPLRDEHSDSGYSSHPYSAPTSSLDSKVESNPPAAPDPPSTNTQGRETSKNTSKSRAPSPDKNLLRRTQSKGRGDGASRRKECLCDKCVSKAHGVALPTNPYPDPNYVIAQARQKQPAPPSPSARRAYPPDAAMPLREHVRPRPAVSRARPMSFHAGATPEPLYLQQPQYVIEQPSARQTAYPFAPPAFMPPPAYYEPLPLPPQQPPLPPPQEYFAPMPIAYELLPPAQPRPRRRPSEHSRSRPQTMYYDSPPIFEYAEPSYRTLEPAQPVRRQLSRRGRRESLRQTETSPSEDMKRMPPPPPPPPKIDTKRVEQRPPMRHAATTASAYTHHESLRNTKGSLETPTKSRSSRKGSTEEEPRSRRPSLARQTRTSDERAVSFDDMQQDMGRLTLDTSSPAKSRRRSSVYGHESLEALEGSVEEYQSSKGTPRSSGPTPSHDEMLARLVRKRTNTDSETGSRLSAQSRGSRASREGSDSHSHSHSHGHGHGHNKPLVPVTSQSRALDRRPLGNNEVASAKNENDRFALRFNPEGINVKMQGGIEGRAINLRKSKDGQEGEMELMIEGRAGPSTSASTANANASEYGGYRGRGGSTSRSSAAAPAAAAAALLPAVRERDRERDRDRDRDREREREREKSRRRYSFIEGRSGGVQEIFAASTSGTGSGTGSGGFDANSRSLSIARYQGQSQSQSPGGGGGAQDEGIGGPRVIGERIVTTTRSRRSSRYGYERYEGGQGGRYE